MVSESREGYHWVFSCVVVAWLALSVTGYSNVIPLGTAGNLELSIVESFVVVMVATTLLALMKGEAKHLVER